MFESPSESQSRTSLGRWVKLYGVIAIVFLAIIGVTLYVSQERASEISRRAVIEPYREGSSEFDSYSRFIQIEQQEHQAAENLLRQVRVATRAILFNNGDRTLSAVEVRAVLYDANGNEILDRVSLQVPNVLRELDPGESMYVQVIMNDVPAGVVPAAAKILLNGLRLKESEP